MTNTIIAFEGNVNIQDAKSDYRARKILTLVCKQYEILFAQLQGGLVQSGKKKALKTRTHNIMFKLVKTIPTEETGTLSKAKSAVSAPLVAADTNVSDD